MYCSFCEKFSLNPQKLSCFCNKVAKLTKGLREFEGFFTKNPSKQKFFQQLIIAERMPTIASYKLAVGICKWFLRGHTQQFFRPA